MEEIDLPRDLSEPSEDLPSKPVKKRRRAKQTVRLEERLALQARDDRERARSLPPGKEREDLLRHARRIEEATRMAEWLSTPPSKPQM
jgi:hypothetical protein